jgi:hypothetical protein
MNGSPAISVTYRARRLTVHTGSTLEDFRSSYESAVPSLPANEVRMLIARNAPWDAMLDLISTVAPLGFLIYFMNDVDEVMRMAGDTGSCTSYLMGNHTIAEKMFRYEPSVMLYAPLHTAIWATGEGEAQFSFDMPSDQFASFGNPAIDEVGIELDHKMAALLDHLDLPVPDILLSE